MLSILWRIRTFCEQHAEEENDRQAKKDEKPSLASVILSNMQIDVNTLHIRYEDDISHMVRMTELSLSLSLLIYNAIMSLALPIFILDLRIRSSLV